MVKLLCGARRTGFCNVELWPVHSSDSEANATVRVCAGDVENARACSYAEVPGSGNAQRRPAELKLRDVVGLAVSERPNCGMPATDARLFEGDTRPSRNGITRPRWLQPSGSCTCTGGGRCCARPRCDIVRAVDTSCARGVDSAERLVLPTATGLLLPACVPWTGSAAIDNGLIGCSG
eukprot:366391-Chlamydomonas_euryale.AAC.12